MLNGRWTISHRCSWITVYESCCSAQMNIIVDTWLVHALLRTSLSVNCPATICLPIMLVIYYGEIPLVNCGPWSILLHLIIQSIANTVLLYSLQTNIILHTIRLILYFQQASEIDNLTISWGKVFWLCCVKVPSQQAQLTPSHAILSPTGSITLVSYWGNLLLHSWYLPLGVSQRTCVSRANRRHDSFKTQKNTLSVPWYKVSKFLRIF